MVQVEAQKSVSVNLNAAILIFLVAQSGAGIWWAATMTERLSSLTVKVSESAADRYRSADAARDRVAVETEVANLRRDFEQVKSEGSPITDRRLSVIEYRLGISRMASSTAIPTKSTERP